MPQFTGSARPLVLGAFLLAAAGSMTPLSAQESGSHPLDAALEMMNLKTKQGAMPDFVTQSRDAPGGHDYLPIGGKPPARDLKAKSAAEVKALTSELDAAHDAQLAGKRPQPMGRNSPASPKPVAAKTAKTAKAHGTRAAETVGEPLALGATRPQATNR